MGSLRVLALPVLSPGVRLLAARAGVLHHPSTPASFNVRSRRLHSDSTSVPDGDAHG